MPLNNSDDQVKLGNAIVKLMQSLGKPDWFQGIEGRDVNGITTIVLGVNVKLHPTYIKTEIPRDVEGIPIKLVYKSPSSRFYGRDGSSTR